MATQNNDKQINAKDQGVSTETKPKNQYDAVVGYISSERQSDGKYKYYMNINIGTHINKQQISEETAKSIGKEHGVMSSTGATGTTISLNSDYVADVVTELTDGEADLKAMSIKGNDKEGVSLIGEMQVTDWNKSSDMSKKRKQGEVTTGPKASESVEANDTGKGGSGNGNGASDSGEGTGANDGDSGLGLGIGNGNGYGIGDGDDENSFAHPQGRTQETQQIDSGSVIDDKSAASNYAHNLLAGEINHIFHNDFYNYDPVPAWSFSVDFIPLCMNDPQFAKIFTMEDSKTLTKAMQKITANEKTINVQSINYLGMQHPFFTKLSQSHGDLQITFAEDEYFTITNILKCVLKYASFLPNFPTNQVYTFKKGAWGDEIEAHAADDDVSPQYRLNATDLSVDDPNLASLVHNNKFVFDIVLKIYKADNAHIFADDIAPPGFVYHFHKCWLKNVNGIDLNYDDDSMINRDVIFSYQYMSSVPYYVYRMRNQVHVDNPEEEVQQSTEQAKEMVKDAESSISKSPAYMTPEGAKQFVDSVQDQTRVEGARRSAEQQSQYAAQQAEMHKYRR